VVQGSRWRHAGCGADAGGGANFAQEKEAVRDPVATGVASEGWNLHLPQATAVHFQISLVV